MNYRIIYIKVFVILSLLLGGFNYANAGENNSNNKSSDSVVIERRDIKDELIILWTSADREVAKNAVFMYAYNSKNFQLWKHITIIVWGPSQKVLAEDKELQEYAQKMMNVGIEFKACLACADEYGVIDNLKSLGVNVKYMAQELSMYIDRGNHLLTF